jgi:cytochrome c-type protein NapB
MTKLLPTLLSVSVVLSCTTGGPPAESETVQASPQPATVSVPDSEIGLAPGTVFEQPPQAPIAFNQTDPGESELRARPNDEAPPPVPHSIQDIGAVTLAENPCLDCHDPKVAADVGAPPAPASHRVDGRRSPDRTGEEIVGARWVCTSCHVPQTDTAPLVANPSTAAAIGRGEE